MFSVEQLQAFITTVETGSFSAAARRLNKVQSVVSQHVINLEVDCNILLFDRSGRYPALTEAGEKLLPHAQAVIDQHQRLKNSALSLTDNTPKEITIALDEGISFKLISGIISNLQNEFPNITLEFLSASSPDIIDMLKNEKALTGIVFSELTIPSYLDFECIGSIKFDLYVAKSHPLANQVCKNIDSLRLHRQLLIRSRNTQSSSFQLKLSPNVWYADNYFLLLELALQGNGWCLLPNHIANESVESGQLVKLPLEFEEMGWQANVDVVQHQRHSNLAVFKVLRLLLRNLL
ncbi:LysR family transcriptional regulator [Colwellia psychrerythraea]|uniref:Transcription regulator, LysR family n=1 Tax=Colwellia psychrerythraea (strain 34H / ATCC BAA-681) TaxID=167879 RepID=Q489T5_COLP3|nr:LysR family transcriptional regulator [Colwellia psychrerythraea]AAZ25993.1 transcription regulator, LysR family [Colwellia psychrerythraea 34H]